MNKKITAIVKKIKEYEDNSYIPQANDIKKILLIVDILKYSFINSKDIYRAFSISSRQGDYYSDALRFLELIDTIEYGENTIIGLNKKALLLFSKGSVEKNLKLYMQKNEFIKIYEKRIENSLDKKTSTYKRRKQSLIAWKRWMDE